MDLWKCHRLRSAVSALLKTLQCSSSLAPENGIGDEEVVVCRVALASFLKTTHIGWMGCSCSSFLLHKLFLAMCGLVDNKCGL